MAIASILASTRNPFLCLREPTSPGSRSVVFRRYLEPCGRRWIPRSIRACQPSDKLGGDGGTSPSASRLHFGKQLLSFASDNFLPLALVSGVGLGFANPTLGCLADKYSFTKISTCGIFIISGLTLRTEAIGAAVKGWPLGVFGLISILLLTPSFSRLIMLVQLQPPELVTGLAIFCCMPTTLSSGVALTHLAGGNAALALAVTVASNLLGILSIPFWVSRYIAGGVGVSFPTEQLFRSLVVTLLIPLIIGKVIRESSKGFANFVDNNRSLFSKINAICLSMVPWIQVSRSRSLLLSVEPKVFLVAVGIGILLHLSLLAFNAASIRILSGISGGSKKNSKENATAVLLVASQKTLPVMVAVVEQLGGVFGETGLLVLPCVAAHLNQIMIDSILVNLWLRRGKDTSTNVKTA
ncbi:PREDICTED: probable sodium/metabolite cotransporter BASS4, chloroplastic isoform X1 [Camelina sativa]|uniref:Probable sodium/metabolite cotransporter BASS4, chloroplastic isoform X1 n=1 Tax=Camelina sativa TaxID=90675 RepID=A0ABM0YQP5_CAMSA|nr:PREDICTED: probable sodium/metabolite cotransporter BASS4, chloroplastic isoform X1 [Camelina sativa]